MPGGPAIALRYALLGKVLVCKYYYAAGLQPAETMGDAIVTTMAHQMTAQAIVK